MDDTIEKGRNITDDAFQGPNMETLPDEMMLMITKKLDPTTALRFERTSKNNMRLTRDPKAANEICKDMVYSPNIANFCGDNPPEGEGKWCKDHSDMCDKVIFRSDQLIDEGEGVYRIRDGVQVIHEEAFEDNPNIKEVQIPDSVTKIGRRAFTHCSNLLRVTIPNSVSVINSEMIWHCPSLTTVNIGNSVTHIHNAAFKDCISLETIDFSNSLKGIGLEAFRECTRLETVTLPDTVAVSYTHLTLPTMLPV